MSTADNAIERRAITRASRGRRRTRLGPGVALGALGILGFSFSFPATRLAVEDLDPWLVAFGRATGAAAPAGADLAPTRAPRATRTEAGGLALGAAGVRRRLPLLPSLAPPSEA